MLTPEQARVALAERHVVDERQSQLLQTIGALPERLRVTAYGLMGRDAAGHSFQSSGSAPYSANSYQRQLVAQAEAGERLDTLSADERVTLFGAFFPYLAREVELTWRFMSAMPYRSGAGPLRAPGRPELTLQARAGWLQHMIHAISPYHADVVWLARHAAYLGYTGSSLGVMFAAVIDGDATQGEQVFDILARCARGEDEVGAMGAHVPNALLAAARPDGWEQIARLLLAAQREEGVRQVILGAMLSAHPQAFRRLLETIVTHKLIRFTAVTSAASSWLGAQWDVAQAVSADRVLSRLTTLLSDVDARRTALDGRGEEVALALWALASEDVYTALPHAIARMRDADSLRRFAAVRFLANTGVAEADESLLCALADADPYVAGMACAGLRQRTASLAAVPDAFEQIEAVLERLPQRATATAQPMLWGGPTSAIQREQVADLLPSALGERGAQRLIPYLGTMSAYTRSSTVKLLAKAGMEAAECRAALLELVGDRTSWVRTEALRELAETAILPTEAPALEALLTRKAEPLRRSILGLLLKLPDEHVIASADRLMASRNERQRRAGLEALSLLSQAQRVPEACITRAAAYQQAHRQLSEMERAQLASMLDVRHEAPSLENALGLADQRERAALPMPQPHARIWTSQQATDALLALDALVDDYRDAAFTVETHHGSQEVLLGEREGAFPRTDPTVPIAQDAARLPFADVWRAWAEARPDAQRDGDGFDFLRMLLVTSYHDTNRLLRGLYGERADAKPLPLRHALVAQRICAWLARLYPAAGAADFLLDHLEATLATVPEEQLHEVDDAVRRMYTRYQRLDHAVALIRMYSSWVDAEWSDAHAARFWRLARWSASLPRLALRVEPTLGESLRAHRAGAAQEADLLMQLLGPRPQSEREAYSFRRFSELAELSARTPHRFFAEYPVMADLYSRCVARMLEVEMARGEMPTAASPAALSLRSLSGAAWFVRLLSALGADPLVRGGGYSQDNGRAAALSHLLRVTFPDMSDGLESVKAQLVAARINEQRLVEVALFAPQWARHIEFALGWDGFAEAVWWIYAHTKERKWMADPTIRQEWAAQMSEWTALSSEDLYDGAVDVSWFQRAYARLGAERWESLYQAAKYTSSGAGHARAQLFADAMLGRLHERTLTGRISAKRRQDAVCALGLLPLPGAWAEREAVILARYQTLQEFIRTSRGFGAQRRASEQTAARIGLENLARTAGYRDTQRLQWAMELREVADLRAGPITLTRDDIAVSLRIDALGQPHLDVTRAGRALKEIPARLKKDAEVAALRTRLKLLTQQTARMRQALEQAMCREEPLPAEETRRLLDHPTLAPMLEQLVFIAGDAMGYLVDGGRALQSWSGARIPLAMDASLRIAHPHDFYRSGEWSQWQHECYRAERIQPFRQIYRELYLLTEAERQESPVSRRYAGQQVQQQQATALLGQRGWVVSAEDGVASRTFHERGVTASVTLLDGATVGLVSSGLALDGVVFRGAGDAWGRPLALVEAPPLVFSEVMRDLDLVVSVAHRGGVDPESSASTVEVREALVREVCATMSLTNVRLQSSRALIQGALGEYSLHLGSGTVHLLPGGALCIVPVHEQHRGRLFLPFADDDPKTAEIVSKMLLLARDREIKDPLILSQIYARA